VFKISLPPLSERQGDIPLLMDHFIERFNRQKGCRVSGVSREAMHALLNHDWPGNVRELENVIEHAFILCRDDQIRLEDLPGQFQAAAAPHAGAGGSTLRDIEKAAILQALVRQNGKRMPTARELGIDKNTLRRKMIRLGISPEEAAR
jgi:sigma-54 dependent transcriptional regulator, acetoin dehydrogenase operon transcriptional activator AcoR